MEYIFDNERPIYLQLVKYLKIEIISGNLSPGEKIPSVRDFALKVKVNPNTMQKALQELERENLIYTERTNGKYVTKDKKIIKKHKEEYINEKIDSFLNEMNDLALTKEEIKQYLDERIR